ncbi:MAG: hypothetical protein GW938_04380 [Leptospira sp.]|nr:hypothetical protein [Leptospira sp.]NCS92373.1 hypothetical protein [Leptospira sp.]
MKILKYLLKSLEADESTDGTSNPSFILSKGTKIKKKISSLLSAFLIVFCMQFSNLNAAPLDSNTLNTIRTMLVQSRETELESLRISIEKIAAEPTPYLIAISEETNLRIYVRTKAVALLSNYNDPSITSFLETKIDDTKLHESIRKISVKSYTESSYKKTPERVEDFLAQRANDKVLRKSIQSNLETARTNFNKVDKNKKFKPNQTEQEHFRRK